MSVPLDQIAKSIVSSGLMPADDLKSLWASLPASGRPRDSKSLTALLVKQGALTDFQAKELLSGSKTPLVLGDYVLLAKIGAGGMGQVFKARHRHMDRLVAIKLLPSATMKDEASVKRFQREVKAAAKLSHPNIVAALDARLERGVWCLVMEYVEGRDLSAVVKQRGPLPVDDAVAYVLQAARGLAYAHGKGVIHRDIKPANLLVDGDGTVKILDMGLARFDASADAADHQLTNTGQVMGTVDYMAPEQAANTRNADGRSDIYSLGCTLHRLLTGESLFGGQTVVEKILAHLNEAIPSLSQKRPEISAEVDRVFRTMVAKKPDDRYQSMQEVIAALDKCLPAAETTAGGGTTVVGGGRRSGPGEATQCPLAERGSVFDETTSRLAADVETDSKRRDEMMPAVVGTSPPVPRSRARSLPANRVIFGLVAACGLLVVAGMWLTTGGPGEAESGGILPPEPSSTSVQSDLGRPPRAPSADQADLSAQHSMSDTRRGSSASKMPSVAAGRERPDTPSWDPGPPLQGLPGIVTNPTLLPGIARWQVIQRVPTGDITSIDWSSRNQIAVGADDGLVRVYDAATMNLVRVFGPHGRHSVNAPTVSVRWSPDGTLLASQCMGLHVWNTDTGAAEVSIPDGAITAALSWHPAGGKLAVSQTHSKSVRLVHVSTRDVDSPPQDAVIFSCDHPGSPLAEVSDVAWSPDGSKLACAGTPSRDGDAHRAMAVLLSPVGEIEKTVLGKSEAYSAHTRAIAWSPDGRRLALGATKFSHGATCVLEVVSIDSGESTVIVPPDSGQPPQISSIHWSPAKDTLYCVFNDFTQAYDIEPAPRPSQRFRSGNQNGPSRRFALSPDGSLAVTMHSEQTGLRICRTADDADVHRLWNEGDRRNTGTRCRHLADGSLLMVTGAGQRTCRVVGRDGRLTHGPWPLSCGSALNMHLHPHPTDPTTFAAVRFPQAGVWRVDGLQHAAFDGKISPLWLASPGALGIMTWGTAELRMVDDLGKTQRTLTLPAPHADYEDLAGVSVGGPDRRRIAYVTSPDNIARVVEVAEDRSTIAEIIGAAPGDAKPLLVALDRSGDRLAMRWLGPGKTVSVGRLSDGKRFDFRGHTWGVTDASWSPDGAIVYSAGLDGRCFAWQPESGEARPFELTHAIFTGVSADPTTGAVAVKTHAQEIHCLDPGSLTPRWSFAVLPDEAHATFSPGGELLHGDASMAEKHLAWIVDQEDGTRRILSRAEFSTLAAEARSRIRPEDPVAGLPPDEVEAGFRPLTRKDWYVYDRERNGNTWRIGDDDLSAVHQLRDGHPHVWTSNDYRDFELRFDVRLTGGSRDVRTAVCFATPLGGWESMKREGYVHCSLAGDGAIHSFDPGYQNQQSASGRPGVIRPNDWNAVRVTVSGGRVAVFVNEQPLCSLVLSSTLRERSAPISLQFPALSDRSGRGGPDPFEPGLAKGEFRNIRIRRFDDADGTRAR
jgi:serine/threonine protein kinase/WD40 repeat protein